MLPSTLTRVPGAKPWVRGLANVRGHLLPIADLRGFLGGGTTTGERSARVIVANSTEFPVGVVVDEVYGFRRFLQREHVAEFPPTVDPRRSLPAGSVSSRPGGLAGVQPGCACCRAGSSSARPRSKGCLVTDDILRAGATWRPVGGFEDHGQEQSFAQFSAAGAVPVPGAGEERWRSCGSSPGAAQTSGRGAGRPADRDRAGARGPARRAISLRRAAEDAWHGCKSTDRCRMPIRLPVRCDSSASNHLQCASGSPRRLRHHHGSRAEALGDASRRRRAAVRRRRAAGGELRSSSASNRAAGHLLPGVRALIAGAVKPPISRPSPPISPTSSAKRKSKSAQILLSLQSGDRRPEPQARHRRARGGCAWPSSMPPATRSFASVRQARALGDRLDLVSQAARQLDGRGAARRWRMAAAGCDGKARTAAA